MRLNTFQFSNLSKQLISIFKSPHLSINNSYHTKTFINIIESQASSVAMLPIKHTFSHIPHNTAFLSTTYSYNQMVQNTHQSYFNKPLIHNVRYLSSLTKPSGSEEPNWAKIGVMVAGIGIGVPTILWCIDKYQKKQEQQALDKQQTQDRIEKEIQTKLPELVQKTSADNTKLDHQKATNDELSKIEQTLSQTKSEFENGTRSASELANYLSLTYTKASKYTYGHQVLSARKALEDAKLYAEQFVNKRSPNPINFDHQIKICTEEAHKEMLARLHSVHDIAELYTRIIYLLGRTYAIYTEDDIAKAKQYFELSKYLGKQLGLFEEYLSDRSGFGMITIKAAQKELQDFLKHQRHSHRFKLEDEITSSIDLYNALKQDTTLYVDDYKSSFKSKTVVPTQDAYNQVECGEQLAKLYHMRAIVNDNQRASNISKVESLFIGGDGSAGLLKQCQDPKIPSKKVAVVYNTLGDILLNLYIAKIDCTDMKQAIVDSLKLESYDIQFSPFLPEELKIIAQIFDKAKHITKTDDFPAADACCGLIRVLNKQLESKDLSQDVKAVLETKIKHYQAEMDSINKALGRYVNCPMSIAEESVLEDLLETLLVNLDEHEYSLNSMYTAGELGVSLETVD